MGTLACRLTGKAEEMLPVPRGWRAPAWKAPATHNRLSLTNFTGKCFSKEGVSQEMLLQGGHFGTLAALPCSFHPTKHMVQQSVCDGETWSCCQPGEE